MQTIGYTELVDRVAAGTDGVSRRDIKNVLDVFKVEVLEALSDGAKVTIPSFVRFEPRFVPAKRKGEMVRRPDGNVVPRAEGQPAGFKAKAFVSPAVAKAFPSVTSQRGKALKEALGA